MKATPINIEVSDAVTMSAEAGEVNAQVSSFTVTNKGQNGTIEVKKLQVTPQNGYQIVSDTSDFATMDVNAKAFSLKYGNHDFIQPYTNVDEIQPTKTKTYDLTGKIALVSEDVSGQNAGSMVATVGWKEAVGLTYEMIPGQDVNMKLKAIDSVNHIKSIEFIDTPTPASGVTEIEGLDFDGDGGVVGWYTLDNDDNAHVYFSSQNEGQKLIANEQSRYMFSGLSTDGRLQPEYFTYIETIKLNNLFDISQTPQLNLMFAGCGARATTFTIEGLNDLNLFPTATMEGMFAYVGQNAKPFTLDLSGWDASEFKNMRNMFHTIGANKIMLPKNISEYVDMEYVTERTWYDATDNYKEYPAGTIPVGNAESHTLVDALP